MISISVKKATKGIEISADKYVKFNQGYGIYSTRYKS